MNSAAASKVSFSPRLASSTAFRLGDEGVVRRFRALCIRVDAEVRRNAWRQTFIDLLAAILRGRRLNSRATPKGSSPKAMRFAHP
jgi:hypothetical protein